MGTKTVRRWDFRPALVLLLAIVVANCEDEVEDDTGAATEAELEPTTTATTGLPTTGIPATTTAASETGNVSATSTGNADPEISLCEGTAADSGCFVCAKLECCDTVRACELHDTCGCYMNCIDKPWSSVTSCRSECGDPTGTAPWKALQDCKNESCTHAC